MSLSYIELSKMNLIHNATVLRSLVGKNVKFAAAIKANAYGHGEREVIKILEPYVDYFQIDDVDELARVRKITKKPVLVLGYVAKSELARAMKLGCELAVYSLEQARDMNDQAQKHGARQKVHIAIDAHLGREGVMPKDAKVFFAALKSMKSLSAVGMYAHFANIEDTTNPSHAKKQMKAFDTCVAIAKASGFKNIMTHISATSGLLAFEAKNLPVGKGKYDMVRVGVGLYGMWPSEHLEYLYQKTKVRLVPVMTWKSRVALVKTLPAGHTVGYGLTYMTKKETKIAIIPQGYSDGYSRALSSKGEVLIHGTRCRVLGRVAMNMFVVDVSHVADVTLEDEVVLLGTQGDAEITAEEIGEKSGTINYEATTRVSPLLERKKV